MDWVSWEGLASRGELSWHRAKRGGGAVSSGVRGWLLLSVELGTVYISWVNSHYISCSLTVAEVAANNRDDEDGKQDGATAGHRGQAEAQPVQGEEEEEHEEDVGVRGGDGQHRQRGP